MNHGRTDQVIGRDKNSAILDFDSELGNKVLGCLCTVAGMGLVVMTRCTVGRLSREFRKMASTVRKKVPTVVTFSEQSSAADRVCSCEELLSACATDVIHSALLNMAGVGKRDIYNITAPFRSDGQWVIAARVESRVSELSTTMFFGLRDGGTWFPIESSPLYPGLQDPCICRVGLIFQERVPDSNDTCRRVTYPRKQIGCSIPVTN